MTIINALWFGCMGIVGAMTCMWFIGRREDIKRLFEKEED